MTLVGVEARISNGHYADDIQRQGIYPPSRSVSEDIPERARSYLVQSLSSLSAPDGAVMLAASAIDAMLKVKKLTEGSLYKRIKEAAASHLITEEMATWANDVRLDANDTRHADEAQPPHTSKTALRAVDFALALADVMYVLPARVTRGRREAIPPSNVGGH